MQMEIVVEPQETCEKEQKAKEAGTMAHQHFLQQGMLMVGWCSLHHGEDIGKSALFLETYVQMVT